MESACASLVTWLARHQTGGGVLSSAIEDHLLNSIVSDVNILIK